MVWSRTREICMENYAKRKKKKKKEKKKVTPEKTESFQERKNTKILAHNKVNMKCLSTHYYSITIWGR